MRCLELSDKVNGNSTWKKQMIRYVLVLILLVSCGSSANAQETQSPSGRSPETARVTPSAPSDSLQSFASSFWQTLKMVRQQYQIELARKRTGQDIEFRSGEYWVDSNSRLIDREGKDRGYWGIDSVDRQIIR